MPKAAAKPLHAPSLATTSHHGNEAATQAKAGEKTRRASDALHLVGMCDTGHITAPGSPRSPTKWPSPAFLLPQGTGLKDVKPQIESRVSPKRNQGYLLRQDEWGFSADSLGFHAKRGRKQEPIAE